MAAPEGTIVNVPPLQIIPLFTVITGMLLTVTFEIAVEVQPEELLPTTVYVELTVGLTIAEPLENVYEGAPEGDRVKESPMQIAPLLTLTVGEAVTNIFETAGACEMQPSELVPVTM